MIGAIIGDIICSVYEWHNIKTKDFPFFQGKCIFTNDTVITIAVAEVIRNGGKSNDFIDSMKNWGRLYPDAGYGGRFGGWILSDDCEPYSSWGDGSAMRISPCARAYDTLDEVEQAAKNCAAITYNHPEGIKGAQATATAIFPTKNGTSKDEVKKYICEKYGYDHVLRIIITVKWNDDKNYMLCSFSAAVNDS